jgi:hypothetical protein
MSMTRLSIDEAKARLPLPQLFKALNVPGEAQERDGCTFGCPFADRHKHGDSRPSFNFHSRLSRYRCFGCGAAGDGPDFVAEWLGITPDAAVKKFIALAGGEITFSPATGAAIKRIESAPLADEWGDFSVKKEKRKGWPQFHHGADTTIATLAALRGLSGDCLRDMQRMGWLRFCELAGQRAWVLRSLCGRVAQARRLDGGMWHRDKHEFKSWSLPGSCAVAPLGMESITPSVHVVGIAEGGPDFVSLFQLICEQERMDCGLLGFLGASVRIAAPVVERLRQRRVRIFAHADEAGRRAAAEWAAQLTEAGCAVDAFDFGPFGVKDTNDFLKLPLEQRDVEVLPTP